MFYIAQLRTTVTVAALAMSQSQVFATRASRWETVFLHALLTTAVYRVLAAKRFNSHSMVSNLGGSVPPTSC